MKVFSYKYLLFFLSVSFLAAAMETPNSEPQHPLISAALLSNVLPNQVSQNNKRKIMAMQHVLNDKEHVCCMCGKNFSSPGNLNKHVQSIHLKKTSFQCPINNCEGSYTQKSTLERHIAMVHIREKPFVCDICPYACTEAIDLKKHMITHTGEKSHICRNEGCSKAYGFASHRARHEKKCTFKQ